MIKVLDHGHVDLYQHMGDDLVVVNSARISFDKRSEWEYINPPGGLPHGEHPYDYGYQQLPPGDDKLIGYLMRNRHGTPFEHNAFTFDVKAPIFVFREWHRHRIASINEISARYTELPAEWYIPDIENVRVRVGKPGHYTYEQAALRHAQWFVNELGDRCARSFVEYKRALEFGIAPEQARLFLHVNHYSHMFWTVNARSLMNFLSLRNEATAQWEIRQFAIAVEEIWSKLMPVTHQAFLDNGRVAP